MKPSTFKSMASKNVPAIPPIVKQANASENILVIGRLDNSQIAPFSESFRTVIENPSICIIVFSTTLNNGVNIEGVIFSTIECLKILTTFASGTNFKAPLAPQDIPRKLGCVKYTIMSITVVVAVTEILINTGDGSLA